MKLFSIIRKQLPHVFSLNFMHTCALIALIAYSFSLILDKLLIFPIYPDEIAYFHSNARTLIDDFSISSLFPACQSVTDNGLPLSYLPGKALDFLLFQRVNSLGALRSLGFASFASWLGVISFGIFHTIRSRPLYCAQLCCIFLGIVLFGIGPFIFSLARPEIFMLITINISVFACLWLNHKCYFSLPLCALMGAALIILNSFFIGLHPKSVFLAPLLFYTAWIGLQRHSRVVLAIVESSLGLGCYDTILLSKTRASCPEIPKLGSVLWNQYLNPITALIRPRDFIRDFAENLRNLSAYVAQASFQPSFTIDWLPPISNFNEDYIYSVLNKLISITIGCLAIIILLLYIFQIVRRTKAHKTNLTLATLLLCSAIVLCGLQSAKNFYEYSLFIGLLLLMGCLLSPPLIRERMIEWPLRLAATIVVAISFASTLTFARTFNTESLAKYAGPNASITDFENHLKDNSIVATAKLCGITPTTPRIVVDDMTYFAFKDGKIRFLLTYLIWQEKLVGDQDNANLEQDLRSLKSAGVISRCSSLGPNPPISTQRSGTFCCVPGWHPQ